MVFASQQKVVHSPELFLWDFSLCYSFKFSVATEWILFASETTPSDNRSKKRDRGKRRRDRRVALNANLTQNSLIDQCSTDCDWELGWVYDRDPVLYGQFTTLVGVCFIDYNYYYVNTILYCMGIGAGGIGLDWRVCFVVVDNKTPNNTLRDWHESFQRYYPAAAIRKRSVSRVPLTL